MIEPADNRNDASGSYTGTVAMFFQRIDEVRRWLRDNRAALPVLILCIALITAGLVVIAYVLAGAQIALLLLFIVVVVAPVGLVLMAILGFAVDAVYLGIPGWPRFSSLVRRVLLAGLFGTMAILMARGALDQWSYAPMRSVGAGLLSMGLIFAAVVSALDRLPGRGA